MSKLEEFLGLANVSDIKKTITVTVGGKKLELVIRPLTEEEHSDFQRRSNNFNKNKVTFDTGKYTSLVLTTCIVEPNFSNAEFLAKAGCQTAADFLNKKFPAGVLTEVAAEIQKLSGFESYEMEIENAKN